MIRHGGPCIPVEGGFTHLGMHRGQRWDQGEGEEGPAWRSKCQASAGPTGQVISRVERRRGRSGQGDREKQMWTLPKEVPSVRMEPGPVRGYRPSPAQLRTGALPQARQEAEPVLLLLQTKDSGWEAGGLTETSPTRFHHCRFAMSHPSKGSVGLDRSQGDRPPAQVLWEQKRPQARAGGWASPGTGL